jgi:hypothetical protein
MRAPIAVTRQASRLLVALTTALTLACEAGGADSTGPGAGPGSGNGPGTQPTGDITGTFTLATVNANLLSTPVWLDNTAGFTATMYLTGGGIVLRSDIT